MKPAIPLIICVLISACSSQATTSSGDNKAEDNQNLLAVIKQSANANQAFSLSEEQIDMWQHSGCGGAHR